MKKYIFFVLLLLLLVVLLPLLLARLCFAQSDKEIYFWLDAQMGAAYENGQLVRSFRIISGYDGVVKNPAGRDIYKPTPKETFHILWESRNYVNGHGIDMPYSLFFTPSRHAIHAWAWDEPLPEQKPEEGFSSSGCISLDLPDAAWLFEWAPRGTIIYIWGYRT